MIRLMISVVLAFAVATSADPMSLAPLGESGLVTQIRKARSCRNPNQIWLNGICQYSPPHVSRSEHVCIWWEEGFCHEYYGTLAPRGKFVPR